MPYVSVGDAEIYYEERGAGVPLVLLHRFSGSGQLWANHVPVLAQSYRVIVPDLRGHGRSTGPPETIHHPRFAADIAALLDALTIDRAHFVGHSSGGMTLLFLALRYPERIRTLTLVSTTYTYDETCKREMRRASDEMEANPAAILASQRLHGSVHGDGYWKILRDVFRSFADDDARELAFRPADLGAITQPTLVLHGDRDSFFPIAIPTSLYQALPNAELCILPAVGHGLPREAPDLFLRVVTQFLACHADA